MQRKVVAWVLVFAGLAIATAGVWELVGIGWAAVAGGVSIMVIGMMVVDVDAKPTRPLEEAPDGQPAA